LIRSVYEKNKIDTSSIDYIETHGTGTKLGDPIEVGALSNVFSKNSSRQFCTLGSVKANIGHPIASAAMAGLFKVLLAMKNNKMPPQINFEQQNELLYLDKTPFRVNTLSEDWPKNNKARRAALSSYGFSGTNVHMVIEDTPELPDSRPPVLPAYLVCLSGKSDYALEQKVKDLLDWIETLGENHALYNIACSSTVGRSHFQYRIAVVANNSEDLKNKLQNILDATEHEDIISKLSNKENHQAAQILESLSGYRFEKNDSVYTELLRNLARAYVSKEWLSQNFYSYLPFRKQKALGGY
jgi:acyl transferase domain-containing protein